MVVVDAILAVVQTRRRAPFDIAVCIDGGGVAAVGVDHEIVGLAGQGHLVDVGVAAVGPIRGGVMDLAAVGADGAARFGAAAVAGDQHDALCRAGDAAGPEIVEGGSGGMVEHRQMVVGVRRHPDDVFDGDLRTTASRTDPGARFQIPQRGPDDHRDG